jgi:hypothetical protein
VASVDIYPKHGSIFPDWNVAALLRLECGFSFQIGMWLQLQKDEMRVQIGMWLQLSD